MSHKKGKKKGKRNEEDWEDDVANEIEQMHLSEITVANKIDTDVDDAKGKKKRKDKKNKEKLNEASKAISLEDAVVQSSFGLLDVEDIDEAKDSASDVGEQKTNEETVITEAENRKGSNIDKGQEDFSDEEVDFQKEKRKAKKEKSKKTVEQDVVADDDDVEGDLTIKTAAQKRAEKKEREKEKKKKDAQKKKAKATQKETTKEKEDDQEITEVAIANERTEVTVKIDEPNEENDVSKMGDVEAAADNLNENEDEDDGDKKKKKKKKKKAKDEEVVEKKSKKPGRNMIKQMQEALEKSKLEQEKLRLEEEAKQRAFEEAERKRLEKIRLEEERKARQKEKKKERVERLKREGKFLTEREKQQKAQTALQLQAMIGQGVVIPNRGEGGQSEAKKPVRYGKKKTKQTKEKEVITAENEPESAQDEKCEIEARLEPEEDGNSHPKEPEPTVTDDVRDTWDDEEEQHSQGTLPKEESAKDMNATSTASDESDSSDEEDEPDDDGDDNDEEEEEGESSESESEDDSLTKEERDFARAKERIEKRREKAETNRSKDKLRSPVICVMGHVDTGKTKILDKIRHSHVQDGEAGGITQQIGATNVPSDVVRQQTKMIKDFNDFELKVPGLLIIDTPGHESFSNLRSRGSTLCDIAILVVDIMHGLEPQTIESINLLRSKKTPFIVALNKVDRLFEWKRGPNSSIIDTVKKQNRNTKQEFEERLSKIIGEFAAEGLNAIIFNKNVDTKSYISLVPTSAHTGDGMGDLIALIVKLCQTRLATRLSFSEEIQCTVLEVKSITGLGTTVDVILTNGRIAEGQTIVLGGIEGPIVTQVRALLMPQPLKELRVKNQYATFKEIEAAQGVKITGKELDKALAGSPLFVAYQEDEVEVLKKETSRIVHESLKAIKVSERGVCVQASTLGSLEALLEFLKTSKIPYCSVSVGPVHKKDVMKASVMLEHDNLFAVILAFDVKVERDAQELADSVGVKIFTADIIYHLFDKFTNYREELKQKRRDQFKHIAIFPCKLKILSEHIYNTRDPIVVGVTVEAGIMKEGTPVCVPSKEFVEAGIVTGIESNHKAIEKATKGMEVCIKIEPTPGEAPKMYGRHFDYTDQLVSKISRESIDAVKEYFRDDLQKTDWQLMIELKKLFKIL